MLLRREAAGLEGKACRVKEEEWKQGKEAVGVRQAGIHVTSTGMQLASSQLVVPLTRYRQGCEYQWIEYSVVNMRRVMSAVAKWKTCLVTTYT